jgi:arsenate reductase
MGAQTIHFLVLCTGNSARSILAEVLLNELSNGRFRAHSAGSEPAGRVNPHAIEKLRREGHAVEGLRSKSWNEFSADSGYTFDIVITVCDNAAGESCPVWRGSPVTAHWGLPDPAAANEEGITSAFDLAYKQLQQRIEMLVQIPLEDFDERMRLDALLRVHDAARNVR